MNSVMDDNKLLTLSNGERIRLERHCAMLFEVWNLLHASPATVSRCGMVWVDDKDLGYEPYFERWANYKKDLGEVLSESLMTLFQRWVPPAIKRILEGIVGEDILEPMKLTFPTSGLNMV